MLRTTAARSIPLLPLILVMAIGASAMDLAEYRTAVEKAIWEIRSAQIELRDPGPTSTGTRSEIDSAFMAVRSALPISARVETRTGPVEAQHQWLHSTLEHIERESDPNRARDLLSEIDERLSTMLWSLDEFIYATEGDRSKDEDKQALAEILSRPEYSKPAEPTESRLDKLFQDILRWLFGERQPGTAQIDPRIAQVLQIVLIAAVITVVGFALFKLAPLIFAGRFRKKRGSKKERIILGEEIAEESSAADLFAEAEELARSGDLRGAIRKGYIALLCELSDRNILGLARHKTNRDYLRDLRNEHELYPAVVGMTESFELSWYGHRETEPAVWEEFRSRYRQALRRI